MSQPAAPQALARLHGPPCPSPPGRVAAEPGAAVWVPVDSLPELTFDHNRIVAIRADMSVRVLPCPFEVAPLVEAIWWHPMYDDDPEHHLRDMPVRVATELEIDPTVGT